MKLKEMINKIGFELVDFFEGIDSDFFKRGIYRVREYEGKYSSFRAKQLYKKKLNKEVIKERLERATNESIIRK